MLFNAHLYLNKCLNLSLDLNLNEFSNSKGIRKNYL